MGVRFTSKGWEKWLELYVRQANKAHLFKSGANIETLVEVEDQTYAAQTLLGARWEIQARGPLIVATYPELAWRFTNPQITAGYFVTGKDGSVLWWEPFIRPPGHETVPLDMQNIAIAIEIDTEG